MFQFFTSTVKASFSVFLCQTKMQGRCTIFYLAQPWYYFLLPVELSCSRWGGWGFRSRGCCAFFFSTHLCCFCFKISSLCFTYHSCFRCFTISGSRLGMMKLVHVKGVGLDLALICLAFALPLSLLRLQYAFIASSSFNSFSLAPLDISFSSH